MLASWQACWREANRKSFQFDCVRLIKTQIYDLTSAQTSTLEVAEKSHS